MTSLTRREFDSVSAALTDAWLDARRRERLERLGLRPEKAKENTKAGLRAAETATH
jgi:hypothetical protein